MKMVEGFVFFTIATPLDLANGSTMVVFFLGWWVCLQLIYVLFLREKDTEV
jgi:hypothetical protein